MAVLFIGRFQPIHLGHIAVIKLILEEAEEVIILVAAAQLSHSLRNPLTAGERLILIRDALVENEIDRNRVWVIPAQDVSDNSLWTSHIIRLTPRFNKVYSNNPFTLRLFKEAGIATKSTRLINRKFYSATFIRELITKGEELGDYLSKATIQRLKNWDIRNRFLSITSDDR